MFENNFLQLLLKDHKKCFKARLFIIPTIMKILVKIAYSCPSGQMSDMLISVLFDISSKCNHNHFTKFHLKNMYTNIDSFARCHVKDTVETNNIAYNSIKKIKEYSWCALLVLQ